MKLYESTRVLLGISCAFFWFLGTVVHSFGFWVHYLSC